MNKSEDDNQIIARISTNSGQTSDFAYDMDVSSGSIVRDSTAEVGLTLTHVHTEVLTETIDRSKGWLEGVKVAIEIPGIGKFEYEKKHKNETRTTTRKIVKKSE